MRRFTEVCNAVAATSKKSEKVRLVGEYLRSLPSGSARRAAIFLSGRAFPRWPEKNIAVGGSLLWQAASRLSGLEPAALEVIYRKHGDLGEMLEELLAEKTFPTHLTLEQVFTAFEELSQEPRASQKLSLLVDLLRRAHPQEAKYIAKILTRELRIGLKENLVEEAIAKVFEKNLAAVERANMLLGDIGTTLNLAAENRLAEAQLRPFHPMGFMLASPVDTPVEAMEYFPAGAWVEDKYDGIRAQAHKFGREARLYSRTLDELVEFPELLAPLLALPGNVILDGEVCAWREGRALPFSELQRRLGRKQVDLWIQQEIPVAFLVFDLLFQGGELLLDRPLVDRRERLETLLPPDPSSLVQLAPTQFLHSAEELERSFEAGLQRGNEGVVAKAPDSFYTPGRRGQAWLKLKRPLATLDVVVTAVDYGHGKRRGLLSDYTFAVRDGDRLLNIGKAYSGLRDAEIQQLTEYFQAHTLEDRGFRRRVEPTVVLEVAFNNIQRSRRHDSGYALRFPRIVRLRPDKPVEEIDTLERVRKIYENQRTADRSDA